MLRLSGSRQQTAGLRLDTNLGKAVTPGDSAHSLSIKRVTGAGGLAAVPMGGRRSPPKDRYPPQMDRRRRRSPRPARHWAFIPPVRPAVPSTSRADWVRNPIDAFLLARLDREGLKPSPEAERATLLRRASLDLTGLPPTPLNSTLSSPTTAPTPMRSRWIASWHRRTTASDGRASGSMPPATPIPTAMKRTRRGSSGSIAIGSSTPSTATCLTTSSSIEQIAGDLLPNATQDQKVATGFLRNSMINEEGGIDPEQFRMEAMFDRMDAIGKGILGVTIQCAQCHNHKYDPLTQEEYYRIFAFLNNTHESDIAVYTPAELKKRDGDHPPHRRDRSPITAPQSRLARAHGRLGRRPARPSPNGARSNLTVDDISTGGERELPMKDGSMLARLRAHQTTVKFTAKTDVQRITAVRLELLTDPNLPNGGPGRSIKGAGALTEFRVEAAARHAPKSSPRSKSPAPARISTSPRRPSRKSSTTKAALIA